VHRVISIGIEKAIVCHFLSLFGAKYLLGFNIQSLRPTTSLPLAVDRATNLLKLEGMTSTPDLLEDILDKINTLCSFLVTSLLLVSNQQSIYFTPPGVKYLS
jgi:hypothetical protein